MQPPQSRLPEQPSLIGPQVVPQAAKVFGTQATVPCPQTSGVPPPPQVSVPVQVVAQLAIWLPQPSAK